MTTPPQRLSIEANGTVHIPAFAIPFSPLASDQAKATLLHEVAHPLPLTPDDIHKTRLDIDEQFHKPLLKGLHELFSVLIAPEVIGGVQTDVVTPSDGVALKNRHRVLINLHGGGFAVAARLGGQVESIPIAGLGKIKVVTVDYRQGPENKFPAGSEDVAAVYEELLKKYPPENIGIYGCSAGGILTSESLAWFQFNQLPTPGAAGIFGAGALADIAGDSVYTGAVLSGNPVPPIPPPGNPLAHYFGQGNLRDPLISPAYTPTVLAKFPPSLIISGTRDPLMSSAVYTHTQLIKVGIDANLNVWEGMGHCFFFYPDVPESHEAWKVVVTFFDRHLGNQEKLAP